MVEFEPWTKRHKAGQRLDEALHPLSELAKLDSKGDRHMGADPHNDGDMLLRNLQVDGRPTHIGWMKQRRFATAGPRPLI